MHPLQFLMATNVLIFDETPKMNASKAALLLVTCENFYLQTIEELTTRDSPNIAKLSNSQRNRMHFRQTKS